MHFKIKISLIGFIRSKCSDFLFIYTSISDTVFIIVYVDDLLLCGPATAVLGVKNKLKQMFKVTDLGLCGLTSASVDICWE